MQFAIGQIEHLGRTLYVLADAYGNPRSFGYRTREQAESVARLIESHAGHSARKSANGPGAPSHEE